VYGRAKRKRNRLKLPSVEELKEFEALNDEEKD
jgi:hypothetical protein